MERLSKDQILKRVLGEILEELDANISRIEDKLGDEILAWERENEKLLQANPVEGGQ